MNFSKTYSGSNTRRETNTEQQIFSKGPNIKLFLMETSVKRNAIIDILWNWEFHRDKIKHEALS